MLQSRSRVFRSIQLIIFVIFVVSCQKNNPHKENILRYSLGSEISTLDPALSYDGASAEIIYQVYETLLEYDYKKRPYELKPLLSDGLPEISKDARTYTFKIKKNIPYHPNSCFKDNSRFVKSIDFVNQLKRIAFIPNKSPGLWLFEDKIKGFKEFRNLVKSDYNLFKSNSIEGIKTPDDQTLVITLEKPSAQFIYAFSMSFTTPIPIEILDCENFSLNEKTIGTGPFLINNYNPSSKITMEKFKDYNNGSVSLDGVEINIIKEAQTTWLNFLAKKIDFINLSPDNFDSAINSENELKKEFIDQGIELIKSPSLTYWWISFNMKDNLFQKNPLIRKAIAHAINRKKFVELFTNNIGKIANSIIPPGVEGYNENNNLPYSYDLLKAKEFLAQAGYKDGVNVPEITFDVRNTSTKSRQMAEFIKNELSKIGLNIRVSTNTFPAFLQKARDGNLQFWLDGWAMDYPNAENSLQLLSNKNFPPGPNSTYFNNDEYEKYFNEYLNTKNKGEGILLISKMEELIHKELPWIMLYFDQKYILKRSSLKNFYPSDLINNKIKYLNMSSF